MTLKNKTFFLLAILLSHYSYSVRPEDTSQHKTNKSPASVLGMLLYKLSLQAPAQLKETEIKYNIREDTLQTAIPVTIYIGKKNALPSGTASWRFIKPSQDDDITKLNALLVWDLDSTIKLIPESDGGIQLEEQTLDKIIKFISKNKELDHSANFIHFPNEEGKIILTSAVTVEADKDDFLNRDPINEYIEVPIEGKERKARELYKEQKNFEDFMTVWVNTDGDKKLPPRYTFRGGHTTFTLPTIYELPDEITVNKRNFTKEQIEAVKSHCPHFFGEGPPWWVNTELNETRVYDYKNKTELIKQYEKKLNEIKTNFDISDGIHKSIMSDPKSYMTDNEYTGKQFYAVYLATVASKYREGIRQMAGAKNDRNLYAELGGYLTIQVRRYKADNTPEDYRSEFTEFQPDLVKLLDEDEIIDFCQKFKAQKDDFFNKETGNVYEGTGLRSRGKKAAKNKRPKTKYTKFPIDLGTLANNNQR